MARIQGGTDPQANSDRISCALGMLENEIPDGVQPKIDGGSRAYPTRVLPSPVPFTRRDPSPGATNVTLPPNPRLSSLGVGCGARGEACQGAEIAAWAEVSSPPPSIRSGAVFLTGHEESRIGRNAHMCGLLDQSGSSGTGSNTSLISAQYPSIVRGNTHMWWSSSGTSVPGAEIWQAVIWPPALCPSK